MRHVFYGMAILGFLQLPLAQAAQPLDSKVSVSLPVRAIVFLKAGGATTGQFMGFDAKKQQLTLGKSSIQLAEVKKVEFDHKAFAYRFDGTLVIRGEDTAKAKKRNWQNLPFTAFKLINPKLAEINLGGVMKPDVVKGIQTVAADSDYVVDELQFQSADKMTIKVTPYDR